MGKIIYRAESRGLAEHGWLTARHSFSFANYYNPDRMHFGALRVLNDDIIEAGMGFGTHPHENMEIITIPISGALAHKDSMGNGSEIGAGEVQVMSAGSGITHSEFNASKTIAANIIQIWIFSNKKDVEPRYDQQRYKIDAKNKFCVIVSPNGENDSMWIHQNAWLSIADAEADNDLSYSLKSEHSGVYGFVISGIINIDEDRLKERDAVAITNTNKITMYALTDARILFIEVPYKI